MESKGIRGALTNFGDIAMKEVFIDLPDLSRGTDMYSAVRSLPSWKPSRQ